MSTRQTVLGILIPLLAACEQAANARARDPEPAASSGGEPGDAGTGGGEDPAEQVPAAATPGDEATTSLRAATQEIDGAIAAAQTRQELDLAATQQERNELAAMQAELDGRLKKIDSLEERIDRLLGEGKVAAARHRERIDVLANLVATMPPQSAATMVAQMSDEEAQDLLLSIAQIDKRKAAKLIAAMPAARAASISQRYLSRDPQAVGSGPGSAAPVPSPVETPNTPTTSPGVTAPPAAPPNPGDAAPTAPEGSPSP